MEKNPFPGMNPWLEAHWGDVHTSLTTYARDQLQPLLPSNLRARIEEYVSVETDDEDGEPSRRFVPDVRIIEHPDMAESSGGVATLVADEPLVVRIEPETLRYIQIVDATAGHRIVTSIEFLSLANKTHWTGRRQYLKKQRQMILGLVNLVEIDLLRAGGWVLATRMRMIPEAYRRPYRICVTRAARPFTAEVYRTALDRPLPTIRIPLRYEDADVPLNLQTLIDTAYVNGRYADDIDYSKPPRPKLRGDDAQWAERMLMEKGLLRGT
jgi:hypothetical protein